MKLSASLFLCLLLLPFVVFSADDFIVFAKNSEMMGRGKYVREDAKLIYLKVDGVPMSLKKAVLDIDRMMLVNTNWKPVMNDKQPPSEKSSSKISTNKDVYSPEDQVRIGLVEKYMSIQWHIVTAKKAAIDAGKAPAAVVKDLEKELEWVETELGISDDTEKIKAMNDLAALRRELVRRQQELSAATTNHESKEAIQAKFQKVVDLSKRIDELEKILAQKSQKK